jgi:hypothetical protein
VVVALIQAGKRFREVFSSEDDIAES